jgi:hypothetical protein
MHSTIYRAIRASAFVGVLLGFGLGYLAHDAAAKTPSPYRTTTQAERFLEQRYATTESAWAYCSNGYYSRHEQRTGRHFSQRHRDRLGRDLYASFSCVVGGVGLENRNLYVQTRPNGRWIVGADR